MLRLLTGILATIGALVVLGIAGIGLAAWFWFPADDTDLPDSMVLTLDLREDLPVAGGEGPLADLGLGPSASVSDIVIGLDRAAADPRVKGLVAQLDGESPGFAQAQEIGDAIGRFREQGKFALAHADAFGEFGPGNRGYLLATAFDEIHLQRLGGLGLTGVMIETPLLRGLLERLGIEPEGDRRGAYKSAYDTFAEREVSEANLEQLEALAASLRTQMEAALVDRRSLTPDEAARLIDEGPYLAEEALERGLVDRLSYWDEMIGLGLDQGGPRSEDIPFLTYLSGLDPLEADKVVGLVRAVGPIHRGKSETGPAGGGAGSDTIGKALAQAIEDPEVRAILFQIDSPGGSAVASETMARQVRRAVEAGKPVIVAMGEVAASGGYWISMGASAIIARPATLTGSIGVLAVKPVLDDLWDELDVEWARAQRGDNADMWSLNLGYSREGRERLEAFLDGVYGRFVDGVAKGRGMPRERVLEIAEGRVWTGAQALEIGLVDGLGGFAEALERTRTAAGAAPDAAIELRVFPRPRPPWEEVLGLLDRPFASAVESLVQRLVRTPGLVEAPPLLVR